MNSLNSEILFWGGIAVMIVALMLLLLCGVIFFITGKKIKKTLEHEYGKL